MLLCGRPSPKCVESPSDFNSVQLGSQAGAQGGLREKHFDSPA